MTDRTEGLNPVFVQRLRKFFAAAPDKITISSGYRSVAHQQELFDAAVRKYGLRLAPHYVARPGHSRHNEGFAADLTFANVATLNWAHRNAAKFGLHFPMSWENWHIEPVDIKNLPKTPDPVDPRLHMGVPKSQHVRNVQTALVKHGYHITIDGVFGEETDRALRDFQTKRRMKPDGITWAAVWKALRKNP